MLVGSSELSGLIAQNWSRLFWKQWGGTRSVTCRPPGAVVCRYVCPDNSSRLWGRNLEKSGLLSESHLPVSCASVTAESRLNVCKFTAAVFSVRQETWASSTRTSDNTTLLWPGCFSGGNFLLRPRHPSLGDSYTCILSFPNPLTVWALWHHFTL